MQSAGHVPAPCKLKSCRAVLSAFLSTSACFVEGGAVPATVAVLGGVPHVGLTAEQLQRIAEGGSAVLTCRLPPSTAMFGMVQVLVDFVQDTTLVIQHTL